VRYVFIKEKKTGLFNGVFGDDDDDDDKKRDRRKNKQKDSKRRGLFDF
jgi:hypothetical protein